MENVIHTVHSGMSIRRAAFNFNVPHSTLERETYGNAPEKRTMETPIILIIDIKIILEKWIIGLCRKGFSIEKQMLLSSVNE